MKAFVLIGGKATRLEPLTISTPKALVPVLNTPFLEYVIRHLSMHRINDIVLALGHLSGPIGDCLGDGSRFGVRLYYSVEDTPLGSAGAAKYAGKYLGETFMVLNGDIFSDLDFTAMVDLHRKTGAKVTIALTPVDDPTSYGLVDTDSTGRVTRFLEKPKPEEVTTDMINAGAWIVEPDVMLGVPENTPFSFERGLFPEILNRGEPFYSYVSPDYWMDMGTPEKYLQLHRDLFGGRSGHYIPSREKEVVVGERTEIHPSAVITGNVIVGAGCSIGRGVRLTGPVVIGDNCTILDDSVVEDCIIWNNTRLGPRVSLTNCVVADNCRFDEGSTGEGTAFGDNVTVAGGCRLEKGSRVQPYTTVGPE